MEVAETGWSAYEGDRHRVGVGEAKEGKGGRVTRGSSLLLMLWLAGTKRLSTGRLPRWKGLRGRVNHSIDDMRETRASDGSVGFLSAVGEVLASWVSVYSTRGCTLSLCEETVGVLELERTWPLWI